MPDTEVDKAVARRVRAWIETRLIAQRLWPHAMSPAACGRGLKLLVVHHKNGKGRGRPPRAGVD